MFLHLIKIHKFKKPTWFELDEQLDDLNDCLYKFEIRDMGSIWNCNAIFIHKMGSKGQPRITYLHLTYNCDKCSHGTAICGHFKIIMFSVISHATAFDALDADRFFLPQTL